MARTPETITENQAIPPGSIISVTLIRLIGKDKISQFNRYVQSVEGQIEQAPGILYYNIQRSDTQYLITSAWTDVKSIRPFRNRGYDLKAMNKIRTIADSIFSTYWPASEIPTREVAEEKLHQAMSRRRPGY